MHKQPIVAYIGIGSNMGDRRSYIQRAIALLDANKKISVQKLSTIIETDPVGGPPQGKYLNAVASITTCIGPFALLSVLQDIERSLGRLRSVKNSSRTIDLDILLYGQETIEHKDLQIPHPRMQGRDFVMAPLREIAPEICDGSCCFQPSGRRQ